MKYECCKATRGGATDCMVCTKCRKNYHYQCLYPSKNNKDISTDYKKSWICPECSPRHLNKDNTPVRKTNLDDNINLRRGGSTLVICSPDEKSNASNKMDYSVFLEHVKSIISTEISSLKAEFKSFMLPLENEVKALRHEFISVKESLDFFNAKFDDLNTRLTNCEAEIKLLSSRLNEVEQLRSKFEFMEVENNNREQWARVSNIEIYGVPERKNENLYSILQNIAEKADANININTDIDFVTRVAPKNNTNKKTKPIIVRFLCRWKKDDFLSLVRKRKLNCNDLGFNSNNPIYANDHLTSLNKSLLHSVKRIAKEKCYEYVWVKKCCIMVRRTNSSPVMHITSLTDLKKII
ncbi:unnamed protein product [Euphydryas editha]|uniref:Zinc finger PHD-type domain-containing protein n=1 Tax=Euphydryas editha TaxID=104508 RepID=A0AAU9UY30_EUPED|nr:unnamed protein product [Euphydryas editha]